MRLREYTVYVRLNHVDYTERDPDLIVWHGRMRIREMVIDLFRRYAGGRNPTESWGTDGFMAQAWDERGNHVEIHQNNGRWAIVKYQPAILQKEAA